jgi:hypothetical protein
MKYKDLRPIIRMLLILIGLCCLISFCGIMALTLITPGDVDQLIPGITQTLEAGSS